jgi:signal transduction histidine kinase
MDREHVWGLSINPSVVEAHGGRLWAACNEGAGSTFSFTMPLNVVR